MINSKRAH